MRISSNTLYESAVARIGEQSTGLNRIQQQLSSGLRIQSPSDDPIGASRALILNQGQSVNTQFGQNRISAQNALSQQENVLQSVTNVVQGIQEQVIAANNGGFSDVERKIIATELRVRLDELTGLANSRDGVGNYLFGGFKDSAQPFSGSGAATVYAGDNGQKMAQVGSERQMPVNDAGDAVFMNVPARSVFTTNATGSASLASIRTVDVAQSKPGRQYQINFDGMAGYQVFDTTADPTMSNAPMASGTYADGQPVMVDGIEMVFSGPDSPGDTITVAPVRNQSIFKTVGNLIDALETPVTDEAGNKQLLQKLSEAGENMGNVLNHILLVRASGGARLQELESLNTAGAARDIQYAAQLSEIQDLDYVKAISDLTQKQQNLQAAQQSFVKVANLSLFNYL